MLYDAENRLVTPPGAPATVYAYDAQNKRFFTWPGTYDPYSDGNPSGYRVSLYSPAGQRLGTYEIDVFNPNGNLTLTSTLISSDIYFGSRRVGAQAVQDRLGSAGSYYPYGEARGALAPDTWGFATYWRDASASGPPLNYADQRYYSSQYGRFLTPDPARNSAGPTDPGSWNRYAYTRGDPVNRADPGGLYDCPVNICYSITVTATPDPVFTFPMIPGMPGTNDFNQDVARQMAGINELGGTLAPEITALTWAATKQSLRDAANFISQDNDMWNLPDCATALNYMGCAVEEW